MDADKKQNNHDSSPIRKEVVSIGKHSSVYFIGQALSRAVGFFMIPVYTRFIAPTNYGAMEMIEIISSAIGMIVTMGIADAMPRYYYDKKNDNERNKIVSTIIIGFGSLGIPMVLFFIFFSNYISLIILDSPEYQYYLQLMIASVWVGLLCEIGFTYLRMRYLAKIFVSVTITQLALALGLNIYFIVYLRLDILGIFYSTLITQTLVALVLTFGILRKVGTSVSLSLLKDLIAFGLPLVPSRISLMLGFVSNRFFLRWFGAADPIVALTNVGLFSLGHKFGVIINRFVNSPFNAFWNPRRMELLLSDAHAAKETTARVCTYATMVSLYFALLLSSGIESLIEIMADSSYYGAHIVVPFVALSYVALGLESHFSTGILYVRKTSWLSYVSILAIIVILVWNYFFVPIYGLYGAATSNLAGFSVRLVLIYIISQRLYKIPFEIKRIVLMFGVSILLFLISQMITFDSTYLTFVSRLAFVGLFPIYLFLFNFYKEGELEMVGTLIDKGKVTVRSTFSRKEK